MRSGGSYVRTSEGDLELVERTHEPSLAERRAPRPAPPADRGASADTEAPTDPE